MPSDFTRIRDNVQTMVDKTAPAEDINGYLEQEGFTPSEFKTANENYGTFVSAVKRGGKSTGSLIADFLPMMGTDILEKIAPESWKPTLETYKQKQLGEAQKTQEEIAKKLPAQYESYKDITGPLGALGYAKEAVGEALPSMLPAVATGGIGAVLGQGAVRAAGQAAFTEAAEGYLASQAAKNVSQEFAKKRAQELGAAAAARAMATKGLQVEAGGALAGSAALNMPDAYQAIYDPRNQDTLLPALASGAFNSVLDAITPFNTLRLMKSKGITPTAAIGAWYKQGAKELGKGFLTEGATEALQEMSNAKAEQFVKNNPEFFTPENLTRFIDAGLKGGLGGGVLQGGVGALMAKNVPPTPQAAAPVAPVPPQAPGLAPEAVPGQQGELFGAAPQGPISARMEPVFKPSEAVITPEGIDTGKIQGYRPAEPLAPQAELTGEQTGLAFPGQQELFEGAAPIQPEKAPAEVLRNVEGEPAGPLAGPAKPIGVELQDVVTAAKEDPTASKILKGNNAASADIVAKRIQSLMPEVGDDTVAAMEALYAADKTGKYPAGTKPLSEAQSELLQTAYRRITGKDIETAVKDRALQSAQQAELFPQGAQNEGPVQVSNVPGTAPADVGVPAVGGEPGGAAGVGGLGEPGLVGGEPTVGGGLGGAQAQPSALNPNDAWNIHRDEDQPAFSDLSPEEQTAWTAAVTAGRGNAVNFQDVLGAYTDRTAPKVKKPGKTVALPAGEISTETNIANQIRGKQAAQVAQWVSENGPASYRDVAKRIAERLKEFKKLGFEISFKVLTPAEGIRLLATGAAGVTRSSRAPGHWKVSVEVPPTTATFETVLHELLHSVTTPALVHVEKGRLKGSNLSQFYKDLEEVSQVAWTELKNRVENGEPTAFERATYKDMNNAFGDSEKKRANMVREVISWSLTNPQMQAFLESIPYKGKNLFTKFVEAFRNFLGLTPKADTALSEILRATEGILNIPFSEMQKAAKEAREPLPSGIRTITSTQAMQTLEERMAPSSLNTIISNPPVSLTQTQAAPNAQSIAKTGEEIIGAAKNVWNNAQKYDGTGFRVQYIDKISGLSKTLSKLPIFQNGQLRADMLLRSFNQVINLVQNGMQSGIPIVNADGTVGINRDAVNNLAHSQYIADGLDNNAYVKASGKSGRQFIAEVARALRGEEILKQDENIRADAARKLFMAKAMMAEARMLRKAGAPLSEIVKLVNQARALQHKYLPLRDINREKQVTDAHIKWAKAALQAVPETQQVLDIWRNVNMGLVDLWEKVGLLTEEKAAEYRSNVSYVPLYISEVDLSPNQQEAYGGKATGTKSVKQIKALKGSEYERNLWENMSKHYAMMTTAAFQNQTRKVAVGQLMSAGINAARYAKYDDKDVNLRYKDPTNPEANKDGIVSVVLDNPNDLAAFQMMSYELGPIMQGFTAMTQVLRTTALVNPMYWIKQLIRDPIHANMVAGTGVITPFHSLRDYIQILSHNSEEAKLLASRGVIGPVDSIMDVNKFLEQVGSEKTPNGIPGKLWDKIRHAHEASDAATRVSVYKKAYAEAIAKGMSKDDAVNYGVFKSRESINFSTRGNAPVINALRHSIPFFSAAVNSLDTVYRAATGYGLNPEEKAAAQQMFMKRAAMMTILSVAYAMMMQDDEDYKNLPDDTKDNNWLFPNPVGSGHSFIKIPVPFEIGFLFKTLPEVSVRYMAGTSTGKEALSSYGRGLIHNMPGNGILIPQLVRPGLEAITNFDFYNMRTIESVGDQNLPVELRGRNASELAKNLSPLLPSALGFSPAKIDHIIQGYMAEWGTFGTGLASSVINEATGKQPASKNIEQVEGLRAFMTNPNASKAVADYYDLTHTAQETVNEFNRYKKEGLVEEAQGMLQDEEKKRLIAAAPALRRVQENMAKVRANINLLRENQKMDPETRRDEINRLQGIVDRMAKQGLQLAEQLKIR